MMAERDPQSALPQLQREVQEQPASASVHRNLGFALAASGKNEEALAHFERARELDGGRPETLYALGRSAEALGRPSAAAEAYAAYLRCSGRGASVVKQHLRRMVEDMARAEIDSALAAEGEQPARSLLQGAVCVPNFVNVSGDSKWKGLSRGLAALTSNDLAQVHGVRLLERARLDVVQQELAQFGRTIGPLAPERALAPTSSPLGVKQRLQRLRSPRSGQPYYDGAMNAQQDSSYTATVRQFQEDSGLTADGRVGPKTAAVLEREFAVQGDVRQPQSPAQVEAPRLGRLLRAQNVVQGTFVVAEDALRLGSSVWAVDRDAALPVREDVNGHVSEALRLQKDLVFGIVATMGIQLTPEEEARLGKPATENLEAFLAYCEGLEYEDQGDFERAIQSFRRAVALDPAFTDARSEGDLLSATPEEASTLAQAWQRESLSSASGGLTDLEDRLASTGKELGFLGDLASEDLGGSDDPTVTDAGKIGPSTSVIVTVTGQLPAPPRGTQR